MSYRGIANWPPVWIWRMGKGVGKKTIRGEVGVLKDAYLSILYPRWRIYLIIEHENEEYMGCLIFTDSTFCGQIYQVLDACRGYRMAAIGDLDIDHLM